MRLPELPPHAKRAGASLIVVGAVLLAAEHAGRALVFAQGIVEAAVRMANRLLDEADAADVDELLDRGKSRSGLVNERE